MLALSGVLVLAVVAEVASIFYRAMQTVPSLADPAVQLGATSQIYDSSGNLVTTVPGTTDRQPVAISAIPVLMQQAFIATEDRTFYTNIGVSFKGILRAALIDVSGRGFQGGSTISQQLARNLYLNPKDTLTRKLREAVLAIEMNRRYTKPEILDMYLNEVYLGEHARGVEAASIAYFNQPDLSKLTLPQVALLAGLPDAPSADDPIVHPHAALARRSVVLQSMLTQHVITPAQAAQANAAPLGLDPGNSTVTQNYPDPWFVDAVITTLEQPPYNLPPEEVIAGGLKIYTTLDQKVQTAADQAVQAHMKATLATFPGIQIGEVVLDQHTGAILALEGGWQHTDELGLDRAIDIKRQPGSTIKPLVDYIPALESGLTAGTVVDDVIHAFPTGPGQPLYEPTDDNPPYYGLTTFTEALRRSVNTVAVQVLNRVGVNKGVDNAVRMGLPLSPSDRNLAVAIGGISDQHCCSPLDMATAYAAIANGGERVTPYLITKVVGPDGRVLFKTGPQFRRVVSPQIAYVMTKMLEAVTNPMPGPGWNSNWGTGWDGQVHDNVQTSMGNWPTAGKTGTTDQDENAWFVSYTPVYTTAVWLGADTPKPYNNLFGGTYAGPIARDTMAGALAGMPIQHFPRPSGVVQAQVDAKAAPWTVAAPTAFTPPQWIQTDWFVQGTQPTQGSTVWKQLEVTPPNNPTMLWSPGCPTAPVIRSYDTGRNPNPPFGGTSWQAWGQALQQQHPTIGWDQFLPADLGLAPPTQVCGLGLAGAGGTSTSTSTNTTSTSTNGTGQGSGTQSPIQVAAVCQDNTWRIVLRQGQPMSPSTICVTVGQRAQITFVAADHTVHMVTISGLNPNEEVFVPADGTPITLSFTPTSTGSYTMQSLGDAQEVGTLTVKPAPTG